MSEIKIEAGASPTVRAIARDGDEAAILQADVYDIIARVYDRNSTTPTVATEEWTLDVASVVFDTLQDDAAWDHDTGYNFKWTVDGSWFPLGGRHYHVDIEILIDSGADLTPTTPVKIEFDVKTKGRIAS